MDGLPWPDPQQQPSLERVEDGDCVTAVGEGSCGGARTDRARLCVPRSANLLPRLAA